VESDPAGREPHDEELLVFVSDASADADRLTAALRTRGYSVIDVPLSLLVSRVAVQRPALVLCDIDAPAALETITRLREVSSARPVDIIFVASPERAGEAELEGSGTFARPVDVSALLQKVEALIGPPFKSDAPSAPPAPEGRVEISLPEAPVESSEPPERASSEPARAVSTTPPMSARRSGRPASSPNELDEPSLPVPVPLGFGVEHDAGPLPRQMPQSEMSPELEKLLARAEQRLEGGLAGIVPASTRLSPEEEVEAVLPADVLAALDEPLDLEEEERESDVEGLSGTHGGSSARTGTGGGTYSGAPLGTSAGGTVAGPLSTATPGSAWEGQPAVPTTAPPPHGSAADGRSSEPPTTPPQMSRRGDATFDRSTGLSGPAAVTAVESLPQAGAIPIAAAQPWRAALDPSRFGPPTVAEPVIHTTDELPDLRPSPPPWPRESPVPAAAGQQQRSAQPPPPAAAPAPPPALEIPAALGPGDGLRALARAVRSRYTGAIAFEDVAGIRRVVLRDGDFVTAASGAREESLIAFLAARGMLPQDAVARLGHRLPPFGRHAGAALIAHGHLRQDELWPVLRGHAEWIVAHVIATTSGAASLERQVPPRLQAEPAVFGGATGAEVLVEVVRRVVAPEQATTRLGGRNARFADGAAAGLLGECALPEHEAALVNRAKSCTVQEVLDSAGGDGFASALYALTELGVLELLAPSRERDAEEPPAYDKLDDDAVRERIRARRALVDEGDYFALLGLSRSATAYDIRRAYLELRREFEPSRVLTAATADLRDDAQLIVEVLDEAYEILREERRRERYRRALEAAPR
jgi:hypothetical protein